MSHVNTLKNQDKSVKQPVLFSAIQPTGELNIGHYLGAIRHWVSLQEDYNCLFALVDLHAITVLQDPKVLPVRCYDLLALYLACGLHNQDNTFFIQSQVSAHSELAWILNCYAAVGDLYRMTQFKDKSQKYPKNINLGLLAYPVLMAADILLYQTDVVPVGEDQAQHLELTRRVARRFNQSYGQVFTIPKAYIAGKGARIMRLQDPTKKMSKSDPVRSNTLYLLDPPDQILKKIKRAVTDSGEAIRLDETKPGINNLLHLFSTVTQTPISELESAYQGKGYGVFKSDLAEAVVEHLRPIQERFAEIRPDLSYLKAILVRGAQKANQKANTVLDRVHQVIGLIK